ncbi:D-glycero-D-manno-heptose 1,7-bisphosphate phosphatase [Bradyrhizobium japonicum]|uniref:D-glycero-alpha-D-manno-heptose-1,7-bisphosphate 7-phosphatase n=2 Tax=Bradyrhizobium japonicum TaxID=375 RepID=UPI0021684E38|nr:HAD family hydrolase [Bradyrhizobium japonicum]MCS3495025.1 D-glycero-D-manno-heptose 1,7-bisphosphate phosphatase [Bradyrhizobium japonicum]MCS3962812.1 D-glycero-D-manno-heptose 1,7-bisphosphate phosphatase [Bradyrhizobium japonicum]MCS3995128.1 D-glycero-D-manno-heptose 1,7-bisphosphate phosphatase [Bradyrhizobium japonicum]
MQNPADPGHVGSQLADRRRRPAVFFDRDGVLNVDKDYVHRIDDFEWMEGAREAVKLCNDLGYYVFVVTNQSGVARGYFSVDDIHRLHDWMNSELGAIGAHIDDFQYCPYHEEGTVEAYRRASDRRKPAPGMILDCMKAWPVRAEGSLLVGDNARDIEAAVAAGIPGHLFRGGDLAAFLRPLLAARS